MQLDLPCEPKSAVELYQKTNDLQLVDFYAESNNEEKPPYSHKSSHD